MIVASRFYITTFYILFWRIYFATNPNFSILSYTDKIIFIENSRKHLLVWLMDLFPVLHGKSRNHSMVYALPIPWEKRIILILEIRSSCRIFDIYSILFISICKANLNRAIQNKPTRRSVKAYQRQNWQWLFTNRYAGRNRPRKGQEVGRLPPASNLCAFRHDVHPEKASK